MGWRILGRCSRVVEIPGRAGAGNVRNARETGALSTSFTSSQGLLLMIHLANWPGQLMPFVRRRPHCRYPAVVDLRRCSIMWPSARPGARHAVRQQRPGSAGFRADLAYRHPAKPGAVYSFLLMVSGTSHEINKIAPLADDTIRALLPRARSLSIASALNRNAVIAEPRPTPTLISSPGRPIHQSVVRRGV